jgi:outer membrane lipoprotein SlyB
MQSTETTSSAVAPRPPIHPLVKVAAVSVIAASAVGIWAMTARTHSNADAANAPANTLAAVPAAATDTAAPAVAPAPEPTPAAVAPAKTATHNTSAAHSKNTAARETPAPYQTPGQTSAAPVQVTAATPAPPPPAIDPTHGHIESVYTTEKKGESKGVGAVAGGAVGGLVGNSFGRGNGRTAATLLGVVGGALAGNEIEKHARTVKTWHVVVKLDDGSTRTLNQDSAPGWRQGEEVRLVDGRLTRLDGSVPAAPKPVGNNSNSESSY